LVLFGAALITATNMSKTSCLVRNVKSNMKGEIEKSAHARLTSSCICSTGLETTTTLLSARCSWAGSFKCSLWPSKSRSTLKMGRPVNLPASFIFFSKGLYSCSGLQSACYHFYLEPRSCVLWSVFRKVLSGTHSQDCRTVRT
jgi:hypothetical protein